jgi:transcriptional regulator with XRE-family HTH domain
MPTTDIPEFPTVEDLQVALGRRVAGLRLRENLRQADLARNAGVSPRALVDLEAGKGSSVQTLLRVLHALGRAREGVDALAPAAPTVSPMQYLRLRGPRKRARPESSK